ncbi:VWA domain-containing protein [Parashewanella spongiae]|uniref:VWA domain-containing protein n=1 Tax=Parashewanella spongiae TaxID=342950 RepID=A0A3A6U516_9GAMM|nr:VWA domain-containing protein [Parashewanella spongiae]MCL1076890.1 VWA domain-containing protein [Parashewanella spongiae]RJY19140.1 VWA domain-containing protein [Parashewanella spongiae]
MSLHFIRPEWLWALLPLLGLLFFLWRNQDSNTAWSRYIAPHLAHLLMDSGKQSSRTSLLVASFIWLIGILALSGPALTKETLPVFASTQGRVIVMDMSLSMYATDLAPNRLSQAKFKAIDLLKEIKEGETGLIAYAGDAFTISPLTRDSATLQNLLPTLTPDIMPVLGSDAASGLTQAVTLLKNGGHLKGDIILLTDGINSNQLSDAKKALAGENYRLAIMGFGTKQGAAIRLPNGQLLRDNADQVVVAKTEYDILSQLTNDYQGVVTHNSVDDSDVKRIAHWFSVDDSAKLTDQQGEAWLDLGPYLSLLLLPLLLLSFRKGFSVAALFFVLSLPPAPAEAALWEDLWQTQNQQAQQAYQDKDYQRAAGQFNDPQWQASADYKAGNYQKALEGFEQDSSAESLYNQGNSLMQLNKLKEAQQRYQQAIDKNPDFADAKHNLDLAKQLEQQQKQNQSGNGDDNKDQDNKGKNENNQEQNKTDKQDQQDKNNQQNGDDSEQQGDQGKQKNADQQNQEQQNQSESESESQQQSEQDEDKNQQSESQPQPQNNEEQKAEQQQAEAEKTQEQQNQENPQSEQQSAHAKPIDPSELPADLPPEMQRVLNAIQDDPQLLLRNKMQLEYQKRRQKGRLLKEKEQW